MFHDMHYLVVNKFGVAYSSDLELVKKLLLETAHAHPEVITHTKELAPIVYLKNFGDSTIDFELQSMIRNVNLKTSVLSDINFTVAKVFAEHGIQFAYPHREVTVLNWPKSSN